MKVVRLNYENIAENWDLIKFGVCEAEGLSEDAIPGFCLGLLKNLLRNEYQCWFAVDDEQKVKMVLVTEIVKDYADRAKFIILTGYGYLPTTASEKEMILNTFINFCKAKEVDKIITYTNNEMLGNYYDKIGFSRKSTLFERII